jgi:hypothetical protein
MLTAFLMLVWMSAFLGIVSRDLWLPFSKRRNLPHSKIGRKIEEWLHESTKMLFHLIKLFLNVGLQIHKRSRIESHIEIVVS